MFELRPRHFIRPVLNLFAEVNRSPVWVLGNQKSGTTAIANLVAEYGGLSKSIDFGLHEYEAAHQLIEVAKKQKSAEKFVRKYKWEFSKDLIKEPHLTFLFEKFAPFFPDAKVIFIIRDPRDNIRSILDRVNLPGDKTDINIEEQKLLPIWKDIIINEGLNLDGNTYIEKLAHRWCAAADVYLNNNAMTLIRYEAFNDKKVKTIAKICGELSIPQKNDISSKVDIQYQPSGNASVSWDTFFGQQNLERIESICGPRMAKFGYNIKTANS